MLPLLGFSLQIISLFAFRCSTSVCEQEGGGAEFVFNTHSILKYVNEIPVKSLGSFLFTLSFQQHYGPGIFPISNKNKYQEYSLGVKARPAPKADNLTAVPDPIV